MSDHDQCVIFMSRTYHKYPVLERDTSQSDGLEEGRNICILGVNVLPDALVARLPGYGSQKDKPTGKSFQ